jgi:beta-phosphoglucomutase-like phosphatase (HAD superfamily)
LRLRWIFWDNDGVLVDTEGLYRDAVRDPEPYLKALEIANAAPDESLVIEDSEQGLKSAIAAGISCVVVKNHYFGAVHDFTGAAAVLSSITELPGTIDRYFSGSPQL